MINTTIAQCIAFFLSHIPLEMIGLGILLSIIHAMTSRADKTTDFTLGILLFCTVGVTGIWGFIMHAFFASFTSQFIGWAPSPFEFEVALANLGLGLTGLIALWRQFDFRLAVVISATCFLWGAAAGHLYQSITVHNFAAGNTGAILYTDIIIPLLLWLVIAFRQRA